MNLPDIKTGGKSAILANDANQWTRAIKELDARVGTLQKENRLFEDATRFIKYNSDTDSQAYSVVQIGSLILDDGIDARTLKLTNGYKVDLSRGYIDFGITGPSGILANSTGKVLTSGTTAVRINIQSVYHNYADIEHGSEALISGWQGRARILWKASATTGEQWCIVEFPTTDWVWKRCKVTPYVGTYPSAHSFVTCSGVLTDSVGEYLPCIYSLNDSIETALVGITGPTVPIASTHYIPVHFGYAPAYVQYAPEMSIPISWSGLDFGTVHFKWYGSTDSIGFKTLGVAPEGRYVLVMAASGGRPQLYIATSDYDPVTETITAAPVNISGGASENERTFNVVSWGDI